MQNIPYPKFTLKGVLVEDIVAVFTPKINSAFNKCLVRVRELAEGKRQTECVSMTFERGKGTIFLTLGLEGGVKIYNTLYIKNIAKY